MLRPLLLLLPVLLVADTFLVGVSGSFLRLAGPELDTAGAGAGETQSGLFGGLSSLSADCSEAETEPRERGSCGDLEDTEEKEGEGDLCAPEDTGDTEAGDNVRGAAGSEQLFPPLCSENRRVFAKKLGLEFLKQGELGGTGGRGSLAGL